MLRPECIDIDAFKCFECMLRQSDPRRRDCVSGGRHTRRVRCGVIATPFKLIDDLYLDSVLGACVYTGGLKAGSESAVAHVALADDTSFGIELRYRVGTIPNAVLTT